MKVAISSGKGGTGKTTLSVNLASYLAEETDVTLVDLDVEEPDSGLFLKGELISAEDKFKMVPERNKDKCELTGNCQKVCNFNAIIRLADEVITFPELCHSCYACVELCPSQALKMIPQKIGVLKRHKVGALNFVEGTLEIGREQAVPMISQTKEYVEENFPNNALKLYDSPPGTSCPVIEATKDADLVILITEPTPFGLHDLKLSVDAMRKLKKKFVVAINRYGIGNDETENYCEEEGIEIIARFKNDRAVAELYSRGELLFKIVPEYKSELEKVKEYIFEMIK